MVPSLFGQIFSKRSRYSNKTVTYSDRTVIYSNRIVKSSPSYIAAAVLIRLGVLLLTLILVEWLELVAMTLFIFFCSLTLKIWSEGGPLTHWPALPPMGTIHSPS